MSEKNFYKEVILRLEKTKDDLEKEKSNLVGIIISLCDCQDEISKCIDRCYDFTRRTKDESD